jgi:hypothetical protein
LGQLPLVAQQLGGTLHLSGKAAARKGLQGATLHLPGGGALDMSRPAHRLLGIELAAFSKALEQQLTAAKAAPQQVGGGVGTAAVPPGALHTLAVLGCCGAA